MRAIIDILSQTFRTLWGHKLRSFLTMFGIAWGVGSLLLLVGVGEGFRSGNKKQLATLGEDVIFLFSGEAPSVAGQRAELRHYQLNYEDYLAIRNGAPEVRNVTAILNRGDIRAVSESGNMTGQMMGVTPNFNQIRFSPVKAGRWLNQLDDDQERTVAILGTEIVKILFPGRPALGATILLNGVRFEVIGLLDQIGRGDNIGANSRIMIPIHTGLKFFPYKGVDTPNAIAFINYQPQTRGKNEAAKDQVHRIIARRHGFDYQVKESFQEWDTIKTQENLGRIFDAMNMFLGSVGLVTMALGAIGIINIMLVSVAERTQEIGLRKAIGATNRSVLLQFFLEGAFLTLLSGGLGVVGAAAFMALLSKLPTPPGFDTPRIVPATAAISIAALSVAGIVAGLFPARKAAMLQPVEALRKE